MSYSVLIIEDEPILARNITVYLERSGLQAQACASAEAALTLMEEFRPDVIVLDHNLPGRSGLDLLRSLRQLDSEVPVVMTTGHGNEQVAVDAMKAGAFDYLVKPVSLAHLRGVLERAVHQQRQQVELRHLRRQPAAALSSTPALDALIGRSPAMNALRERLRQVIDADLRLQDGVPPAVLISGETGTGKELVARALHFDGPRRAAPFVELNCASLPVTLVESELFGHERGAFTDARERRMGLVEAAHGGTLFLDEVAELEPATQAKLLKLLEDRRIRRLGSVREQSVDVRVLAASHRRLEQMVANGQFRADLYYRLGILEIELPPLRARDGDVALLADRFLARLRQRYGKPQLRFSAQALQRLEIHAWPGNVRELANLVEQCVILAAGDQIGPEDLPLPSRPDSATAAGVPPSSAPPSSAPDSLPALERRLLAEALARHGWNVTQAARTLGISRDTLRYRIDKHALSPDKTRS